ncbi:MAG: HEAT repeat domain-containing protein, partial [Planctomycetota bacterium]
MRTKRILGGLLAGSLLPGVAGVQQDPALAERIERLDHPETGVRRRAVRGLAEAGPKAVPLLRGVLRSGRSQRQLRGAALALGQLGRPGLEALLEFLGVARRHETVAFGLRLAGKAAVEPLISRLGDEIPSVRRGAAHCLGALGRRAWAAAPNLLKTLGDPSPGVRAAAARALGSIQAASEDLVPSLLDLLDDPDAEVRGAAIEALGRMSLTAMPRLIHELEHAPARPSDGQTILRYIQEPESPQAVPRELVHVFAVARLGAAAAPRLTELLTSGDETQRWRACLALGTMGSLVDPQETRSALSKLLGSGLAESRLAATWAMGRIGGEGVLDIVAARLQDLSPLVRQAAVLTLGSIGSAAVPLLESCLESGESSERAAAACELGQLARQSKAALEALIANLDNEDGDVRLQVERGLLQIPERAVPALIEVLESYPAGRESGAARALRAVEILGRTGPRLRRALPQLLRLLGSDEALRLPILRALAETGFGEPGAVEALIRCLSSRNLSVRLAAVRAIGDIGPPARRATELLERLLETSCAELRLTAAWALRRVDPRRSRSYQTLVEELGKGSLSQRRRATKRLGRLASPAVAPVLARALEDPDGEVRYWAAWGLRRLGRHAAG